MGVLETFFRISMVLTIILIGMNSMLLAFANPMTGTTPEALIKSENVAIDDLSNEDLNTISSGVTSTNILRQLGESFGVPQIDFADFGEVQEAVLGFGGGYQNVLKLVFDDLANGDESIKTAGRAIRSIILVLQTAGLAYIPFALWSAFKGGGSP